MLALSRGNKVRHKSNTQGDVCVTDENRGGVKPEDGQLKGVRLYQSLSTNERFEPILDLIRRGTGPLITPCHTTSVGSFR